MVSVFLLSTGVVFSICLQFTMFTRGCIDSSSEEIDDVLVTTSVMWSLSVERNGQCTSSACEESSAETDETDPCRNTSDVCDCSDIKANGFTANGVYLIYVDDQGQRHYANASCDMTTTNDGWTVFQRRKDGSVDFYIDWNDYANGFGNPNGEFWLGNNFLHLLTSKRSYRLRIDMEDFEEEQRYAEYSTFNISSPTDKYRLGLGNYSGTAGDSLVRHNGQRFSTRDSDNDAASNQNCSAFSRGAWWYHTCTTSNLNGLYLRGNYSSNTSYKGWEGILWYYWHRNWYSLKTTEMKLSSSS